MALHLTVHVPDDKKILPHVQRMQGSSLQVFAPVIVLSFEA